MTPEENIRNLLTALDDAVNNFNSAIPAIQKQIASEIELFVKDLDIKGDTVVSNVKNLRKIAAFKDKLYSIIQNSEYGDRVNDFIDSFNTVADLQNTYFESISDKFKPTKLLEEIKAQSIGATIDALTENGLNANLINPIHNILLTNSTTGGSWSEMAQQLRTFITKTDSGVGQLERYTKQITTDTLNQFSGQYMDAVTNDLSLSWYMYDGAIIGTSRPFCEACVKKKYIHRDEFAKLIEGDFPEFDAAGGVIYDKTGLPSGMIEGTNPSNLVVYRGGYNCGHSLIPVSDAVVPQYLRDKFG